MEPTNSTHLPFCPASRDEIGQRARSVGEWLGVKHLEATRFLADLYGFASIRDLQRAADAAAAGEAGASAGPFRQDDAHDKRLVASHIEATVKRFLSLGAGDHLVRASMLARCGLYAPIAAHRHACKQAAELYAINAPYMSKRQMAIVAEPLRRRRPPAAKTFFEFELGDRRFYGVVLTSDLYIADEFDRWAYLGPSEIHHIVEPRGSSGGRFCGPGWYICKYEPSQITIPLEGFAEADAVALAGAFGMEVGFDRDTPNFYESKAAEGLRAWVGQHKISARRHGPRANYLRNWHET